jgi:hypothetical protein
MPLAAIGNCNGAYNGWPSSRAEWQFIEQDRASDQSLQGHYSERRGTLVVWQYSVHKASNGDLEQVPLKKIGLIAHDSLRVEPYSTPLEILPHD